MVKYLLMAPFTIFMLVGLVMFHYEAIVNQSFIPMFVLTMLYFSLIVLMFILGCEMNKK